ncbi:hypothetical protein [Nonomuraea roseoviolacea]|uniref:WXG100 family type VII secretion target n=1 Tax=Nonomuraea roseoviolacea subsp. carminata TaxID=160689 RepID=A0ABT1JZ57_9ACTN|nr:hypothetical protein [Nonomuraea roseoviolacea]MCP2347041.1 hypothetical protein [Nonomuraea roseoviolacea subsp. carminata]
MSSDPDHVLDAIDGVVDEWEALSADAMRWVPPEKRRTDLVGEVTEIFAPLTNALAEAFRPLGDAVTRLLDGLTGGDDHPDQADHADQADHGDHGDHGDGYDSAGRSGDSNAGER